MPTWKVELIPEAVEDFQGLDEARKLAEAFHVSALFYQCCRPLGRHCVHPGLIGTLDIALIFCYFKKKKGKNMNKERLILDTDSKGNLKGLPKFPPNKKVEAIFLIVDRPDQKRGTCRFPHRDIAGKIRIMGNIFDTVSESEWNLPK